MDTKIREGVGVFLTNPSAAQWQGVEGMNRLAGKLNLLKQAAGTKTCWIAVQTRNGGSPHSEQDIWRILLAAEGRGIEAGIWTVGYGSDPAQEARWHANDQRHFQAPLAIFNGEAGYHGASVGDPVYQRSLTFLDAFDAEALYGDPVLGLSTLGGAAGQNVYVMPHYRWKERFSVFAQAYYNAYDVYHPALCEAHWLRAGWPIEKIKLTLGVYTGEGKGIKLDTEDYVPLIQALSYIGTSIYDMEQCSDDDLRQLGQIVAIGRAGGTFSPPPPPPPPPDPADGVFEAVQSALTAPAELRTPEMDALYEAYVYYAWERRQLRLGNTITGTQRATINRRVAASTDAQWKTLGPKIKALLDGAGVVA